MINDVCQCYSETSRFGEFGMVQMCHEVQGGAKFIADPIDWQRLGWDVLGRVQSFLAD